MYSYLYLSISRSDSPLLCAQWHPLPSLVCGHSVIMSSQYSSMRIMVTAVMSLHRWAWWVTRWMCRASPTALPSRCRSADSAKTWASCSRARLSVTSFSVSGDMNSEYTSLYWQVGGAWCWDWMLLWTLNSDSSVHVVHGMSELSASVHASCRMNVSWFKSVKSNQSLLFISIQSIRLKT